MLFIAYLYFPTFISRDTKSFQSKGIDITVNWANLMINILALIIHAICKQYCFNFHSHERLTNVFQNSSIESFKGIGSHTGQTGLDIME